MLEFPQGVMPFASLQRNVADDPGNPSSPPKSLSGGWVGRKAIPNKFVCGHPVDGVVGRLNITGKKSFLLEADCKTYNQISL